MRQEKPLPAELSRAESVMWEHPDSALSILRSMPQSSLSSGKNYATWALLLAQARDKVYGKRLPDSLNIPFRISWFKMRWIISRRREI